MDRPFSSWVQSSAWRSEAEVWIRDRLAERGVHVTAVIAQPRVRAWSTQLVAPTDHGIFWFKANCPGLAAEPAVHAELARLLPDDVDSPVAIDAERGWVLTRGRGMTWAESHEPTLEDWQTVVRLAATMQRRLAGDPGDLLARGLPDCSPGTVVGRFDAMLERLAGLSHAHPAVVDGAEAERLRRARPRVVDAAALLEETRCPASLQHGDLHPGNVFLVDGGLRIFDFGDAQWAHPAEVLHVPWALVRDSDLDWEAVFSAYAECWSDVASRAEVRDWQVAGEVTHSVNRAMTWWNALASASPEESEEWGHAPAHHLRQVLPDA